MKILAHAYFKDGTQLPIDAIDIGDYNYIEFDIIVNKEKIECMYWRNAPKPEKKWLEKDYKLDKKEHCDGHYKKARFDFDHIEATIIYD